MMKPKRPLALVLACLAVLLVIGYSLSNSLARLRTAAAMAESANKFLSALNADQRAKAAFKFEDEQRYDFHFVPRERNRVSERKGVPLKELNEAQRKLAMDFLQTGLGAAGYQKATTIISLEPILAELEGPNRNFNRDPELYFVSIFGTPSVRNVWGWRFEGHHISLNFTVVKGELISNTPLFLGANPREVRQGPRKGLRALAGEEDKGRALVQALDEKQRPVAIYDPKAPADIFTMANRKAEPLKPEGIAFSQLNKQQQELLNQLVNEYLARMPQDVAAERTKKLRAAGWEKIHFAWAGGINKNEPSYYRVQGPTFLIEYDDTQNNANHIHSVWRDFNGDFGADLLGEHYKATPHGNAVK
jgi:hypothetical protein